MRRLGETMIWSQRFGRWARAAALVHGQERSLDGMQMQEILATMQRVLVRPVPQRLGTLGTEVRSLAAAGAKVGGDVYDVVGTPFGVRLFIADVMGKGVDAMGTAADLIGAFRELAQHEIKLSGVAERMDALLAGDWTGPPEVRFATALFVSIREDEGVAELVCCGHPPPLLLRDGLVHPVEPLVSSPPLGLLGLTEGWCEVDLMTFRRGDQLLLYTDGVTEARDARGRFFPLHEQVTGRCDAGPGALLDGLVAALRQHVGGFPPDDAAMLLVHSDPASELLGIGDADAWGTDGT